MKKSKSLLFIFACFAFLGIHTALADSPEVEAVPIEEEGVKRELKVKIVNRRGKPINARNVFVYHTGDLSKVEIPDKKGIALLEDITDSDSVNILISERLYSFPADGLDSINLILRNRRLQGSDTKDQRVLFNGYTTTDLRTSTIPATVLEAGKFDVGRYTNLAEYLTGRVPGLVITRGSGGYTARIRGISTILGDSEPLIISNGMPFPSFNAAIETINVNDIKSVNVLKDGGIYGVRGANGVILIETKQGGD